MKTITVIIKDLALALLLMLPVYVIAIVTAFVDVPEDISYCIGTPLGLLLCILYLKKNQCSLIKDKPFAKPDLIFLILVLLFQLSWTIFSSMFFFTFFKSEDSNEVTTVYMRIAAVLFAPFAEEIVFRYGMIKLGQKQIRMFSATLLSILIFDFGHFPDLPSFFSLLGAAVVYSLIFVATNNLFYTIGAHMFNNFIAALSEIFAKNDAATDTHTLADLNVPIFYISIAMLVITSVLMIKRSGKIKNAKTNE